MTKAVIAITGMPGAGKGTVASEVARLFNCPVIHMGDVIREEAKRRGLEPTDENLGRIMLEIRSEFGPAVVAQRCLKSLIPKDPTVVVDGIRSAHEVEEFRRSTERFVLIAVFASTEKRFKRLYGRKRADDPKIRERFRVRDERELNVGLGDAIAMADYVAVNEGKPEETKRAVAEVIRKIKSSLV